MYWYAMEPLAEVDPPRALALALSAGENIPILKEFMIRRIGAGDPEKSLALLVDGLKQAKDDATRLTFLRGMNESLKGRRDIKTPAGWQEVFAVAEQDPPAATLEMQLSALAVTFGDEHSRRIAPPAHPRRQSTRSTSAAQAIRILVSAKAPNTVAHAPPRRQRRARPPHRRPPRPRHVRRRPHTPPRILAVYADFTPAERRDALATLCSRPAYAIALLDAVAAGKVPTNHLTADLVTNLRNLNDDALNKRIEQVWGIVRTSPADKAKLIDDYKRLLAIPTLARAPEPQRSPLELGRAVFAKTCQQCHTLFGTGGKVGPDITGSQRANLDYLLSNILDPSAVMAKEYQPTIVRTADGRIVTGILKEETAAAISLQTQNELVVISKADIDESQDQRQVDDARRPPEAAHPTRSPLPRRLPRRSAAKRPCSPRPTTSAASSTARTSPAGSATTNSGPSKTARSSAKPPASSKNEFLMSELSVGDFRLELDVKLIDDKGNSGIQIRSAPIENGLMRGYQCDIGPGWWGKLYEEHGRALLESKGGEQFVKKGDWNHYEIVAVGSRVRTWINGNLCVDRDDPVAARRGLIGLQLHSGGETEVRFKNLKLTLIPPRRPRPPLSRFEARRRRQRRPKSASRRPRSTAPSAAKASAWATSTTTASSTSPPAASGTKQLRAKPRAGRVPTWTMHVLGEKAQQLRHQNLRRHLHELGRGRRSTTAART